MININMSDLILDLYYIFLFSFFLPLFTKSVCWKRDLTSFDLIIFKCEEISAAQTTNICSISHMIGLYQVQSCRVLFARSSLI